tara:strand:- start:7857 stop:8087 length:231 start_codon:yes stop_codon:yes gene_type:complete
MENTNKTEKIYISNMKSIFEGNIIKGSISIDSFNDAIEKYSFEMNGKKYLPIEVKKKMNVDEYGNSHYMEINTFKP